MRLVESFIVSLLFLAVGQASPIEKDAATGADQGFGLSERDIHVRRSSQCSMSTILQAQLKPTAFCSQYLNRPLRTTTVTSVNTTTSYATIFATKNTVTLTAQTHVVTVARVTTAIATILNTVDHTQSVSTVTIAAHPSTITSSITVTLAATATIYDDGTSTIQERAVRKADRVPVSEFPHLDKRANKAFIPPVLRKYPAKSLSAACSCLSIPISTTTIVVSRSATVTATTTLPVIHTITPSAKVVTTSLVQVKKATVTQTITHMIKKISSVTYTPGITVTDTATMTSTTTMTMPSSDAVQLISSVIMGDGLQNYCNSLASYSALPTNVASAPTSTAYSDQTISRTAATPTVALPMLGQKLKRNCVPSPARTGCAQLASSAPYFVDNWNVNYTLSCGDDLAFVGDISHRAGRSFSDCFTLCDGVAGCQGFAYNGGTCWFKSLASATITPYPQASVDFAYMSGIFGPTSTSTTVAPSAAAATTDQSSIAPDIDASASSSTTVRNDQPSMSTSTSLVNGTTFTVASVATSQFSTITSTSSADGSASTFTIITSAQSSSNAIISAADDTVPTSTSSTTSQSSMITSTSSAVVAPTSTNNARNQTSTTSNSSSTIGLGATAVAIAPVTPTQLAAFPIKLVNAACAIVVR